MKYYTLKLVIKTDESVTKESIEEKVLQSLQPQFTSPEEVWFVDVASWSSDRVEFDEVDDDYDGQPDELTEWMDFDPDC